MNPGDLGWRFLGVGNHAAQVDHALNVDVKIRAADQVSFGFWNKNNKQISLLCTWYFSARGHLAADTSKGPYNATL